MGGTRIYDFTPTESAKSCMDIPVSTAFGLKAMRGCDVE